MILLKPVRGLWKHRSHTILFCFECSSLLMIFLFVENHSSVIQYTIFEIAISGKASIIFIFDVISLYPILTNISALAVAARFVVPVAWQKLVLNITITGCPGA